MDATGPEDLVKIGQHIGVVAKRQRLFARSSSDCRIFIAVFRRCESTPLSLTGMLLIDAIPRRMRGRCAETTSVLY